MTNNTPDYGPARITVEWKVNGRASGTTLDANRAASYLYKQELAHSPAKAAALVASAAKKGHHQFRTVDGRRVTLSVQW